MPVSIRESAASSADLFVSRLADRLRQIADPTLALDETVRALGDYLRADRVCYVEVGNVGETRGVAHQWSGENVKRLTGVDSLEVLTGQFGEGEKSAVYACSDVAADPGLSAEQKAICRNLEATAFLNARIEKNGKLIGVISAQRSLPHDWTEADKNVLRQVAEQTSPTFEQARVLGELRVSEERLRLALEAAEMGTWEYDIVRNVCWWSERTCEIWGIEYAESIPGDMRYSFVHPDDDEQYRKDVDDAVYSGRPFTTEFRIVRPDGQVRWVLLKGSVTCDAMGNPVTSTGIAVDNSERRQAQERLKRSNALLDAFMRNAPVGMYLKDPEGRYVLVNPEMEKVLGVTAREALGRHAIEILGPEEGARIEEEEQRAFATGQAQVRDQFFPDRKDHSSALLIRFPVEVEGQAARIGGFAIDTTERRREQAELERSREALHQSEKLAALANLLAGVAHELNNPLAVIVAHAELLQEEMSGSRLEADVQTIHRAAERCAKIVETFLTMARQREIDREVVDLSQVIAATLDFTQSGLKANDITLSVDVPADLPPLRGNASLLQQVFANLVINAQHSLMRSTAPRKLTVRAWAETNRIIVDVSDNGPGVAEAERGRIFEPFHTTKDFGEGTGLGLSFSLGVVKSHGGTLVLEESSPERTVFRVSLPRPTHAVDRPDA